MLADLLTTHPRLVRWLARHLGLQATVDLFTNGDIADYL